MKISKRKKELARIISENGGWRDGAEWAAQDSKMDDYPLRICFYENKPKISKGDTRWIDEKFKKIVGDGIKADKQIPNWHQTILSREEYFHLYPAPDADGWIECNGCDQQIDQDAVVEVKFRDGQLGHNPETVRVWCWTHGGCDDDIIAYRLHKPEQAQPQSPVEMAFDIIKQGVKTEAKPTIEQLAADYRNRKDYADRKQEEADAAKADADEALRKLELAGEAIGLIVTPVRVEKEPEMVITDWRDLQVGDVIKCIGCEWDDGFEGNEAVVKGVENRDYKYAHRIRAVIGDESDWGKDFIFIRRP